jgi:hypothetical protein
MTIPITTTPNGENHRADAPPAELRREALRGAVVEEPIHHDRWPSPTEQRQAEVERGNHQKYARPLPSLYTGQSDGPLHAGAIPSHKAAMAHRSPRDDEEVRRSGSRATRRAARIAATPISVALSHSTRVLLARARVLSATGAGLMAAYRPAAGTKRGGAVSKVNSSVRGSACERARRLRTVRSAT